MITCKNAIEIKNVSKHYKLYDTAGAHLLDKIGFGGKDRHKDFAALKDINLTLGKGERVGLVGRNGAGKTTLLKLIVGHVKPTSGTIMVDGSVQAMMQSDLGFHAQFTGRENAMAALAYNGIYGKDTKPYLEDIADFTELGTYFDQPFANYSLGMQSRLLFAVSSTIKPDILIVDEMLGAGDAYFMSKSSKRMQDLIDNGCTLLLVSHNTQQILQFCEKAVWMRNGQIYDEGEVRDVVNGYDVFIERQTELRHQGIGITDKTDKREDVQRADRNEFKTELQNGRKAYRWPSAKGLKLSTIELYADGFPARTISSDQDISLQLQFDIEEDRDYTCRYLVTIWSLKGKRIARIENECDKFFGKEGEKRDLKINLSPLQIGNGDYTISVSIYELSHNLSEDQGTMTRLDVVAHCIDFNIKDTTNDTNAFIQLNSNWKTV